MLAGKQVILDEHRAPAPPDAQAEPAARLRLAIGKLSRRLRLKVSTGGLTPTSLSVLFTVVRTGPVRLADLADDEGLNPTMLSRVVASLAGKGLVERIADPADRRAALVEATAAGRALRDELRRGRDDLLAARLAGLSAADRKRLEAALPVLEHLAEQIKDDRR